MRRVIIESPFAGDVVRNIDYARKAVADCLYRGEAPLASHLLYTQHGVLDDGCPRQRRLGIAAGHAWMTAADAVVVYMDYGISPGMEEAIALANNLSIPVEYRELWNDSSSSGPLKPSPNSSGI